jgi:hypothetical protein
VLLVVALRGILDGIAGFLDLISSLFYCIIDILAGTLRRALPLATRECDKQCTYHQGHTGDLDWFHDLSPPTAVSMSFPAAAISTRKDISRFPITLDNCIV